MKKVLLSLLALPALFFWPASPARGQESAPAEQARLGREYESVWKPYQDAAAALASDAENKELADYHAVELAEAAAKARASGDADAPSLAQAAAQAKADAVAAGAALAQAQAKFAEAKKALIAVNLETSEFKAGRQQQPAQTPPASGPAAEEAELQGEVADAARALAAAKSAAAAKKAALAAAQAKAAADPGDNWAKLDVTIGGKNVKEAEQAVADAQAAMDAKIAQLLKVAPKLDAAVKAAADAKQAAAAERKAAAAKIAAAAMAKADAKNAEARKEAEEEAEANARLWYANTAALAKKAHWIAVVQVARDGKPPVVFRYDHFPAVERVVWTDGSSFVRLPGKDWVASKDWGKTGEPVAKDRNAPGGDAVTALNAMQAAELDAEAEMAQRVFQPDPREGKVVWKLAADFGFEMDRDKPPAAGGNPPIVLFHDDTHPIYGRDQSASLLRRVVAPWQWEEGPARVTVDYFYKAGEIAPPAGATPEEQLAQALAAAAAKPVKVDAVLNGDFRFQFNTQQRVRVAGIVAGNDFDLTVVKGGGVTRQIAVGNDAWSSEDGGATWRKLAAADRTYFDEVAGALRNEYTVPWPVEAADAVLRTGDAAAARGETWRRFERKARINSMDVPDEYWLAMRDGKPAELRRYESMLFKGHLYADYSGVADGQGVLPPPGNAEAVPGERPEELLAAAIYAMKTAGVWRVDYRYHAQEKTGQKDGQDVWKDTQRAGGIHGLISGKDFDLTYTTANKNNTWRMIGIKDKVWQSSDGGKSWKVDETRLFMGEGQGMIGGAQPDARRANYDTVLKAFQKLYVNELYEAAGTETHDGETWLHIRMIGDAGNLRCRPEYWLQLDPAGRAAAVRHYLLVAADGGTERHFRVDEQRECEEADFAPATANEKIEPPAGVEMTNDQ